MKFLNGKEEVIDIEITSYGRYLISKGKFKPHYYSFFDDGVLYDNEYAGITEAQNDIQNRIKNDTPRLQTQVNYAGVDEKISKIKDSFSFPSDDTIVRNDNPFPPRVQADADKFYSLKYPIGSSDLNTNNAPSWNIETLQGEISSSSNYLTGAYSTERIPQLNLRNINYETIVGKIPPNSSTSNYDYVFTDDSGEPVNFINVLPGENEIILSIAENNTFFGEQNFDIEVYSVSEETFRGEPKQIMKPLYFVKKTKLVKDGILLDENSDEIILQNSSRGIITETEGDLAELRSLELDSTYVDYYFSIDVDGEIDEETLCKLTVDKSQGIFSERYLDCSKIKKKDEFDNSRVFDGDSTVNKIGDCE
jgi:hypothetical protein